MINATPWSRQPRYLIHDRDAVYGKQFDARLGRLGVTGVRTPVRAPRANSIAERVVRTFRAECLDHVTVINEHHCTRCSRSSSVSITRTVRTGALHMRRRSLSRSHETDP
jgi:transposase InsO family protein